MSHYCATSRAQVTSSSQPTRRNDTLSPSANHESTQAIDEKEIRRDDGIAICCLRGGRRIANPNAIPDDLSDSNVHEIQLLQRILPCGADPPGSEWPGRVPKRSERRPRLLQAVHRRRCHGDALGDERAARSRKRHHHVHGEAARVLLQRQLRQWPRLQRSRRCGDREHVLRERSGPDLRRVLDRVRLSMYHRGPIGKTLQNARAYCRHHI